jgi:hypothetical protein
VAGGERVAHAAEEVAELSAARVGELHELEAVGAGGIRSEIVARGASCGKGPMGSAFAVGAETR